MSKLRVAIVGCGKIADQHAQQIQRVKGAEIVATCDRELLMARQLAERFRVKGAYDDLATLLREARPDVVHLTTPPQGHFDLTMQCLEAGCHVYVEKPFAIDLREAEIMASMAESKKLQITAGHNVQFSPEMVRMRRLVKDGFLGGAPLHIESVFSYPLGDASYAKALLGDEKHWVRGLPGKLLHNVISHGVAKIAEFLDGPEIRVTAVGFTSPTLLSVSEDGIVDELRVIIHDGRNTSAYFTFTTQGTPRQELRVHGPRGTIIVDNAHRTVVQLNRANSELKSYLNFFLPPLYLARQYARNAWSSGRAFLRAEYHMDAGMKNLIEAFYASITSGGPVPIPTREILLTAAIMDKIFQQLDQTGKPRTFRATAHADVAVGGVREG